MGKFFGDKKKCHEFFSPGNEDLFAISSLFVDVDGIYKSHELKKKMNNYKTFVEKLPNIVCFAISSSFWVDFVPLKTKDWVIVLGKIGPQTSGAS